MAESTLSMAYFDLADEVATYLGYTTGLMQLPANTLTKQQAVQKKRLDMVIRSGLRQFYFPPPLGPGMSPTDWSFLHPTASVPLVSGSKGLQLPDDFGGFEGEINISPSTTLVWWSLPLRNEGFARAQYAEFPAMVSRPLFGALSPLKGTSFNAGQRTELIIFPIADQNYTLQFTYYILPDYLSGAFPYAYGGAAHAETILESCLAMAEQKLDDMSGVHTAKFAERLAASVGMDQKNKPQNLGLNRDNSDRLSWGRSPWWHNSDRITVNGVQY